MGGHSARRTKRREEADKVALEEVQAKVKKAKRSGRAGKLAKNRRG